MKIDIDPAILSALISGIVSLLVILITRVLSRRTDHAQASRDESDAATKLADAAAQQIKTYNEEIVDPLKARIDTLEKENERLSLLIQNEETRYETYRRGAMEQIESLQGQIKSLSRTLESQRQQIIVLIDQGELKEKTIRRMQEEIEQLQMQNEILRTEVANLRKENDALKTRPIGAV